MRIAFQIKKKGYYATLHSLKKLLLLPYKIIRVLQSNQEKFDEF